jgi:predicted nucleic acid-binding protein
MRIALDSNVMIYAEAASDDRRGQLALDLIEAIQAGDLLIPLQALGETLRWLITKGRVSREEAIERSSLWIAKYPSQETNLGVIRGAYELIGRHAFQSWDAIICSAASVGGARLLLSEDMQDGFRWRNVTIVNPFASPLSTVLQGILNKQ